MRFTVPPFVYQIQLEAAKPIQPSGATSQGLVEFDNCLIRLYAALPPARLENVLRHEFFHAWRFEAAAQDMGEESATQFVANASQMFDREFTAQGGLAGLAERAAQVMGWADE